MADDVKTPAAGGQTGLSIPDDVQQKFGQLIDLVKGSESMNDEERQYWVNILPIMTPEQVQNLKEILENEKRQLAAIDEKYRREAQSMSKEEAVKQIDAERRQRREARQSQEASHKKSEDTEAENLLKSIEEDNSNVG